MARLQSVALMDPASLSEQCLRRTEYFNQLLCVCWHVLVRTLFTALAFIQEAESVPSWLFSSVLFSHGLIFFLVELNGD